MEYVFRISPLILSGVGFFIIPPLTATRRKPSCPKKNNQYTFENREYRKTYWHTCSHVLAQAVKRLYPEVKLAIGPSIDNGFYYDLDSPFPFTPEDHGEDRGARCARSARRS